MASPLGRTSAAITAQLHAAPWKFDFFQAVRLLDWHAFERAQGKDSAIRFPVGYDFAPLKEIARFRCLASHQFPSAPISQITNLSTTIAAVDGPTSMDNPPPEDTLPEIVATFMGMTGPLGVLPQHYTSIVLQQVRAKDASLRDFLDIFQHRILSLFYRAWEKYRFPISYERASRSGKENLFTECAFCLLGLGTDGLRKRMDFDDGLFLYHAGSFAHAPRTAGTLENIIREFLGVDTEVLQFQGQWLYLREEDQSSLPTDQTHFGLNCELGSTAIIGERTWDVAGKFRVRVGPLSYAQFRLLMPGGNILRPLCQLARMYAGLQFDFDVQPILKRDEVPWCRVGGKGNDPSYLGWNTWLRSDEFRKDVSDAIFSMEV